MLTYRGPVISFEYFIMKNILFSITFILLAVAFACSLQIKQWLYPEQTVTKDVNLTIVHANPYHSHVYANSTAMLNVMVIRLRGQQMDTLFVRDYLDFKLSKLSSYSKGFNENIHVPEVTDKKEKIILVYNIVYKTKESTFIIPHVNYIGIGITNDKFLITI